MLVGNALTRVSLRLFIEVECKCVEAQRADNERCVERDAFQVGQSLHVTSETNWRRE
uniref:Uncharacterized protein n=1 Tax=blood disease bacterium R229 TaxID=741978 RepID=G2ZJ64_9RALS|nr:hypothetical protein BDB_40030 [blood disease bacterium R229]